MNEKIKTDVLIAGGGMAGVFGALAAARQGMRVMLVDPANVLGGQGTAGGVAGFCGDTLHVNDAFAELVDELTQMNAIAPYSPRADRRDYDLELCSFVLQQMVRNAGIQVLLHSRVMDVTVQDGRITHATVLCGSDRLSVDVEMVIDATGSCVLARQAGLAVEHLGANEQLPMSLYFTMWDTGKPITPHLPNGSPTWEGDDDLPMTTLHCFDSGKVEIKMKVIGFDAASGISMSNAELHARQQMMGLIYYLQTKGYHGKVLDQHILASVSRQIGVREECRIIGEHILTEEQVKNATQFEDAIAVGTYHLDYHWPDKVQRAGTGITTMVKPYQIPLRSLIPRGAKNMLVPGRGASGDQMAMSSFRVMATCAQMGFAAGMAASAAIKESSDISNVCIKTLQQQLISHGQQLDLSAYGDYLNHLIEGQSAVHDGQSSNGH